MNTFFIAAEFQTTKIAVEIVLYKSTSAWMTDASLPQSLALLVARLATEGSMNHAVNTDMPNCSGIGIS